MRENLKGSFHYCNRASDTHKYRLYNISLHILRFNKHISFVIKCNTHNRIKHTWTDFRALLEDYNRLTRCRLTLPRCLKKIPLSAKTIISLHNLPAICRCFAFLRSKVRALYVDCLKCEVRDRVCWPLQLLSISKLLR